ncbi:MAG: head GIN domain-containing protein [Bacteroidota bacterium]
MNKIRTLLIIFFLSGMSGMIAMPASNLDKAESVEKETRTVGYFTGIKVGGAFEVFIKQTGTPGVVVMADADVLPYIVTEVSGNILNVSMKKAPPKFWNDVHTLHLYITVADLNLLDLSGAVEITTQGEIKGEKMGIEISGAVEADLNLQLQKLNMEISGATEIKLTGQAQEVNIEASGASELDAFDFEVKDLSLYASGATEANVNASGMLKISVSGACEVRYKGGASVNAHTSGASSVKQAR